MFLLDLMQYDQIVDELTKEDGIPLIIRCATENKSKPLQVQQPALEIAFALTFNKEAYQQLKIFTNHIKPFLFSPHQGISQIVERIIWKLEIEEQEIAKPRIHEKKLKYDMILSYSQLDKDLCFRIYDELIKDDFRIWIDQDECSTISMNEKSKIIDECEHFVMCTSDTYKLNLFCRLEASYAFERQLKIIPLIVLSNYRPDGWLNRIIHGKIPIDFTKLGFELAKTKLKSDIERQRKLMHINHNNDPISIKMSIENSKDK